MLWLNYKSISKEAAPKKNNEMRKLNIWNISCGDYEKPLGSSACKSSTNEYILTIKTINSVLMESTA